MRLFLASEAKNPATLGDLQKIAGSLKNKKIAYIVTAANGERGYMSWKKSATIATVRKLGALLNILQLEDFRDSSIKKELEGKDIIWFAGGVPGYLMYWAYRCSLDIILPQLLKKGMLFVGSSAGAMVAGQSIEASSWGFVDGERGSENIKPLALVDFDIYPHYREELLSKIKKNYRGKKLYLLKDGEHIFIDNGKIQFFGEERLIT